MSLEGAVTGGNIDGNPMPSGQVQRGQCFASQVRNGLKFQLAMMSHSLILIIEIGSMNPIVTANSQVSRLVERLQVTAAIDAPFLLLQSTPEQHPFALTKFSHQALDNIWIRL